MTDWLANTCACGRPRLPVWLCGQVESWIMEHGTEWVGESWDELKYIRQAVTFLVIGNKPKKTLDDITRDLCPVLSIQQLYRISTMYWDDKYNTETVSSEVCLCCKQDQGTSRASHLCSCADCVTAASRYACHILASMIHYVHGVDAADRVSWHIV